MLLVLGAALAGGAMAADRVPVPGLEGGLPRRREARGREWRLAGTAVLRAGLVFKVYAAALYLDGDTQPGDALRDVPKRLEIHYYHNTPRRHMIETAVATIRRNLDTETFAAVKPGIDALHGVYEDGSKGGYAALTYVPGKGTEFAIGDRVKCVIEGVDFAEAYFGVWLGEQPSSRSVKRQLMEGVDAEP
jgi:hypothetical protein